MPSKVIYDLTIKNGEYNTNGESKPRWVNIGKIMRTDDRTRDPYFLIDPSINFAAFPREPGRDMVIGSCFKPKDYTPNTPISEDTTAAAYAQAKAKTSSTPSARLQAINSKASMDIDDDDMPF